MQKDSKGAVKCFLLPKSCSPPLIAGSSSFSVRQRHTSSHHQLQQQFSAIPKDQGEVSIFLLTSTISPSHSLWFSGPSVALDSSFHAITQALQLPFLSREGLIKKLFPLLGLQVKDLSTSTQKLPCWGKMSQARHFSDLLVSRLT